MDIDEESVFTGRVRTNVVAQEQPVMIWDQKDFEGDELNRKKAGLLFPYHLGVAEDQIATRVDNDASAVVAENMADITNTNQISTITKDIENQAMGIFLLKQVHNKRSILRRMLLTNKQTCKNKYALNCWIQLCLLVSKNSQMQNAHTHSILLKQHVPKIEERESTFFEQHIVTKDILQLTLT
ncbi:uncharacterized protein LOC113295987 [Papaver somniferum]|uniref:uncharacterized protein LOC113295987 n=1 Tax=Papaver somniferum TaxID=3469 RepID=UPI000E6FB839|nr:uncharacterized protein LOC113295987 [Papaver somniferum]